MWNSPLYNTTKLTVELRELIESGVKLWDFEYPSYYKDEQKTVFEQKVIDHFYFRQIGQETTGRFLHQFRAKVREIMPYYIQMYESEALMMGIEDPFGNVDITETFTQKKDETSSGTSSGSSSATDQSSASAQGTSTRTGSENGLQKFSDTPQGSIANLDNYLTTATVNQNSKNENDSSSNSSSSTGSSSSESSSESSGTSSETLTHTFTKKGNQGVNTYAHDMIELRQTFLNIDMMVINELNPLFLGVY